VIAVPGLRPIFAPITCRVWSVYSGLAHAPFCAMMLANQ